MKIEYGFVLLSRNLLDSTIFASEKLLKIFIWCLLRANFKDKNISTYTGIGQTVIKLKRGQFLFGRKTAEESLFIDGATIYKCINKLEELEAIKIESSSHFSIITICNFESYQDPKNYKVTGKEQPSNNQVTGKEQPSNNQVTSKEQPSNTDNNVNTLKKEEEESLSNVTENENELKLEKEIKLNKTSSETREVFEFYNNQGIITEKKLKQKTMFAINDLLLNYTVTEIKEAILNYKLMLNSKESWVTYKRTLYQFLTNENGFIKFLKENFKEDSFVNTEPVKVKAKFDDGF